MHTFVPGFLHNFCWEISSYNRLSYAITIEIPYVKTQCLQSMVLLVEIVLLFAMIIALSVLKTLEQREDAALWVFPL